MSDIQEKYKEWSKKWSISQEAGDELQQILNPLMLETVKMVEEALKDFFVELKDELKEVD